MAERVRAFLQQFSQFFTGLAPGQRVLFACLVLGAAGLVGTLTWYVQRVNYRVLYRQLSDSDAAVVVQELQANKIPYRLGNRGGTIEVPAEKVYEARLTLAAHGLPRGGGVGFELFDTQSLGMTDFQQRINYQRALQGELARTIAELDAVEAARVHLALPDRALFVSERREPSASVVLRLAAGRDLGPEQVQAIVHLVAGSVERLSPAAVTVVDVGGRMLTRQPATSEGQGVEGPWPEYQRQVERSFEKRIETMLAHVLGAGKAVARVTAVLDRARIEKTQESVDPDQVALRSERRSREKTASERVGGVVGVAANLTNENASTAEDRGPRSEREETSREFEVSRTVSHVVEAAGAIERLSVAVLIDGTYTEEGGVRRFVPRPEEEIGRYRDLVKTAVGFDEARGDQIQVTSVPFQLPALEGETEEEGARWRSWLPLARPAAVLIIAVLGLLVLRSVLVTAVARFPAPAQQRVEAALPQIGGGQLPPGGAPVDRLINANAEFARQDPQRTAIIIRRWLAGEE